MIKKQFYVAPEVDVDEIIIEQAFLQGTNVGTTDNSSFGEQGTVTNLDDETWIWGN